LPPDRVLSLPLAVGLEARILFTLGSETRAFDLVPAAKGPAEFVGSWKDLRVLSAAQTREDPFEND
jgi:hypothetical protein